jgi:hypothetical protein
MGDLTTTNILLGVMATVSLLEALAVIALLWGGFILYRRTLRLIEGIEERQVAPVAARVTAILDDFKGVTAVVGDAAKDANAAARWGLGLLFSRLKAYCTSS